MSKKSPKQSFTGARTKLRALPKKMPPPNLNGDYKGSCVRCLRGADTGLILAGEAEWCIAGLITFCAMLPEVAEVMCRDAWIEKGYNPGEGEVPVGELTLAIQLCERCAAKSGVPVAVVIPGERLPVIRPLPSGGAEKAAG